MPEVIGMQLYKKFDEAKKNLFKDERRSFRLEEEVVLINLDE
jgi:hypothetical protein